MFLIFLARKKLRKETVEIEEVLHNNLSIYKKAIDQDVKAINVAKTVQEKAKIKLKQ